MSAPLLQTDLRAIDSAIECFKELYKALVGAELEPAIRNNKLLDIRCMDEGKYLGWIGFDSDTG